MWSRTLSSVQIANYLGITLTVTWHFLDRQFLDRHSNPNPDPDPNPDPNPNPFPNPNPDPNPIPNPVQELTVQELTWYRWPIFQCRFYFLLFLWFGLGLKIGLGLGWVLGLGFVFGIGNLIGGAAGAVETFLWRHTHGALRSQDACFTWRTPVGDKSNNTAHDVCCFRCVTFCTSPLISV